MITYKIYGHPSRIDMVRRLQKSLNLPNTEVYLDDRPEKGYCIYTAKKAWLAPLEEGETHRLALPEDMEICNGFKDIVERIVRAHPNDIIGLFPFDYEIIVPDAFFRDNTPYIECCVLSCCGTIIPVQYIKPCFDWIYEKYHDEIADDTAIQAWARRNGVKCITTIPSTVQHLGDTSLVTPNAPIRRTRYFQKDMDANVNWDNPKISAARMAPKPLHEEYCVKGSDGLWRLKPKYRF